MISATITGTNGIVGMVSFHFDRPRLATVRDREVASRYARLLAPLLDPRETTDTASAVRDAYANAVQLADEGHALARTLGEAFVPEPTPALELAVHQFMRNRRDSGARIEAILVELKRLLAEAAVLHGAATARELYDAAIGFAIRAYFDDCEY